MKQYKSFLIGVIGILLMTFIVFVPMNAKAATITNGKGIKLLQSGKQFYKFTLEDDALLQVSWSNYSSNPTAVSIYYDVNKLDILTPVIFFGESGKNFYTLRKGTYYVDMYENATNPTTIVKFNWTLVSTYDKANYSKLTAEPLKADTIEHVAQVGKYAYTRWYKIKVSKEKKLTIKTPYGNGGNSSYGGIYLLNSKSRIISLNYSEKEIVTAGTVPAGTYYITVRKPELYKGVGSYVAFKWK